MKNPLQLEGRTILVTGASSGIGRGTAVLLSELGANVVLAGRDVRRLEDTAAAMRPGNHRLKPFDLNNLDGIPEWLSGIVDEVGPMHGLAHCAGVAALLPLRVLTTKQTDQMMRINFYSAVALTTGFCRKRAHHDGGGSVVLVASVAGLAGVPGRAAYSASKGALIAFARSSAIELARNGIRVNCVAPAYVKTEMYEESMKGLTPEQLESLIANTQPLGLGAPLDVAHAIAFLLADTGRWITGSVLAVDGGYTAQ